LSLLRTSSVSTSVWSSFSGIVFVGDELDINRAVEQRLPVAVHGRYQRGHILQIAFRGDRLLEVVGVGARHAVFVGSVMDDAFFPRAA
jgi:hypothetical protein